jgi:hypothetical protein
MLSRYIVGQAGSDVFEGQTQQQQQQQQQQEPLSSSS